MIDHSTHITLEDAVARMINLDYIPEGFTLLEMTNAFLQEAKENYERGQFIGLDSDILFRLKYRYKVCKTRHELAEILLTELYSELSTAEDLGNDTLTGSSEIKCYLELNSFSEWSSDVFGISLQTPPIVLPSQNQSQEIKPLPWQNITIKIYADNYLGCTSQSGRLTKISFGDVDLMGKRNNEPNELGGLLIGLSHGIKFPQRNRPEDKEKTLISKLRKVLKNLTGNEDDPFYPFTPDQGWKPKFKLIDDRDNAGKRAKERAIHVPYDDNRDLTDWEERPFDDEDEDDEAGQWLKDNQ